MTQPTPIRGVLPVVQTLFDDTGAIDSAAMVGELTWVLDQGVAGLTTGMVSEILRLTEGERRELSEVVVGVARDRGALSIVSAGAESTRTAVAHARHAESIGADAVMAIPPISVALDDSETFAYFAAIADATTIGLVVQDASGYVGRPLSIEVQVELFERYSDRIYFKPEAAPIGPRLSELRNATGGEARAFEGSGGAALIDSYRRGIVGTMPGTEVCWGIQRMWRAVTEGDWAVAYAISGPLNAMVSLQTSIDTYVAIEKHLLVRQGVIASEAARRPLSFVIDGETRAEVDRLFDQLKVVALEHA
ncbi:dihydrodipicolinate synthase family protein [Subtercola endophyticus]|uniref:dihydrodipicolinate synthase family protein n=1 Tax=Subtercola endophyticus TaxID=2895559 RepID=UPI001E457864|nr:dihydrodipicolinate synthase family protein [Subtercola endophyticus]UFS58558.1 dihydrodipicolinate synthase family protein [Subtercola endophyticus]